MTGRRFILGLLVCLSCQLCRGETVVNLGAPDNAGSWLGGCGFFSSQHQPARDHLTDG